MKVSIDQTLTGFRIYETTTRYYIIGHTQDESHFSIVKIDRTVREELFVLEEDDAIYDKVEIEELLAALAAGNSASGGLQHLATSCGIIGLIRFTANFYLSLITKRTAIALLGGHYVYHIDDTKLIALTSVESVKRNDRHADEARYLAILQGLEIGKTFYFSNTYDITHTLQYNLTARKENLETFLGRFNEMFVWNHYLLKNAFYHLRGHSKWCVPIIHGFIDQAKLSIFGKSVYITLIARRSRHFAGARFLKRGANEKGFVANDVETEQIISEQLTTPFHNARGELSDRYTSFVQHRGSIPLNWTQTVDGVNPKPPIELNVVDPFFTAAALHFDHMFARYGTPVVVINLVKARERTPRETLLLKEFTEAILYLNQFLPKEHQLRYVAWDMSRASKSRDQEVIGTLEKIAQDAMKETKFFHSGTKGLQLQSGVSRTNCIDCLDRTNAAQFVIGKHAMSMQLYALGLVADPSDVKYDCDAVSMMIEMYHDHGDTVALQYGGSHLVNTMETYRKINQWHSHSRDMIESIRRFYHNSFLDAQRQEAINLFLGNFKVESAPESQNLWEMENDYRLHYNNAVHLTGHRDYRRWWTPEHLEHKTPCTTLTTGGQGLATGVTARSEDDNGRYWQEYYRLNLHSHLKRHFCFHMNDTVNYHPSKSNHEDFDPSPFVVRAHGAASTTAIIKSPRHKVEAETKLSNEKGHRSKLSLHRWLGHASYERASSLDTPSDVRQRRRRHYSSPSSSSSGTNFPVAAVPDRCTIDAIDEDEDADEQEHDDRMIPSTRGPGETLMHSSLEPTGDLSKHHHHHPRHDHTVSNLGVEEKGGDEIGKEEGNENENENGDGDEELASLVASLLANDVAGERMRVYAEYSDLNLLSLRTVPGTTTVSGHGEGDGNDDEIMARYAGPDRQRHHHHQQHRRHHHHRQSLSVSPADMALYRSTCQV